MESLCCICSQTSLRRHISSACLKTSDPTLSRSLLKTSVSDKIFSLFFLHECGRCICTCVCMFRYVWGVHTCTCVHLHVGCHGWHPEASSVALDLIHWGCFSPNSMIKWTELASLLKGSFFSTFWNYGRHHAQLAFLWVLGIWDTQRMYLSKTAWVCCSKLNSILSSTFMYLV